MNHDPFKINEAILDLWRDLKAGEDYIERLEIRNASLVKELDELRASSFVTAVPVEEYDKLKTEVERLRFAGDILAFTLAHGDRQEYGDPSEPIEEYMNRLEIKGWLAAKEGKQP